MTEKRAEKFFEQVGVKYDAEPDCIEQGKKPDFFCSGREDFWCEVKTLGPTNDFKALGDAHEEMRQRAEKISLKGRGFAWVSDKLDHRDAKAVMSLLEHSLLRFQDADAPKRLVAVIPKKPSYDEFVRFSITTKEYSNVEIHSCVSTRGKYELPHNLFPDPYLQTTQMHFSSEDEQEYVVRDILTLTDDFRVAIEAWQDDREFDFVATMPTGVAKELNNPDRIREAVAEANSQFKNAIKYRKAPCLLTILHDAVDVPEDEIFKSALYGDLKFIFSRDKSQDGKFILDGNGAWNKNKNRTTSAVLYIRNQAAPILIHNYWEDNPFPQGFLPCNEIIALEDGTFEETEARQPRSFK